MWGQTPRNLNFLDDILQAGSCYREVPGVDLSPGIAKGQCLLLQISGESHKPDFTIPDLN